MTKRLNNNLKQAKSNKKDEFYTQLVDIENELKHYKEHFKGKVVFCNCDDPQESNFWRYFSNNFEHLGLKKLVATHFHSERQTYKLEITKDINNDGKINNLDTIKTPLKQNGDFRSDECIKILKEADIVVTNPPFSLFREYVSQLADYEKKFIIVGHQNAITYKEIFKLIKENKLWLGYGFRGGAAHFINSHYEDYATAGDHKEGMIRVSGVVWFTNLEHQKRNEELTLYKKYTAEEYPHYDNYNAINVDKTKDIPCDWAGAMGVPITFLDKFNPEQFEIIGFTHRNDPYQLKTKIYTKEDDSNFNDLNGSPILKEDGKFKFIYMRIIIRNKKI
jgi:hypothetical protein